MKKILIAAHEKARVEPVENDHCCYKQNAKRNYQLSLTAELFEPIAIEQCNGKRNKIHADQKEQCRIFYYWRDRHYVIVDACHHFPKTLSKRGGQNNKQHQRR